MDFVLKMMNFILKVMEFVLKMMDFAGGARQAALGAGGEEAEADDGGQMVRLPRHGAVGAEVPAHAGVFLSCFVCCCFVCCFCVVCSAKNDGFCRARSAIATCRSATASSW